MGFPDIENHKPEDFFVHGHHIVLMPDKTTDEYDTAIPDYYVNVMLEKPSECIESNGSTADYELLPDGRIQVTYVIFDREYDNGISWEEKTFVCVGKIVNIEDEIMFKIESIMEKCDFGP